MIVLKKKNNIQTLILIILLLGVFLLSKNSQAAVNKQFNYQGKLTDASGLAVADGAYDVVFNIYTAGGGGVSVWTESWTDAALFTDTNAGIALNDCGSGIDGIAYASDTNEASLKAGQLLWNTAKQQSAVIHSVFPDSNYVCVYRPASAWTTGEEITNRLYVKSGLFSVMVGSVSDITIDFSGSDYYLGVRIGSDAEMVPRKRMGAVPQAWNANSLVGDGAIDLDNASTSMDAASISYAPASGTYHALSVAYNSASATGSALALTQSGSGAALSVTQSGTGAIVSLANTAAATTGAFSSTNLGSGNSFVINDEATDTTPFVIDAAGNVGIGTAAPGEKLEVVGKLKIGNNTVSGENITFDGSTEAAMRVTNANGYISITPLNAWWAHFYTDRDRFIFNKPIYSMLGSFSSYSGTDLTLQREGVTKITASTTAVTVSDALRVSGAGDSYFTGKLGIGTTSPSSALEVAPNIKISGVNPTLALSPSSGQGRITGASGFDYHFFPDMTSGNIYFGYNSNLTNLNFGSSGAVDRTTNMIFNANDSIRFNMGDDDVAATEAMRMTSTGSVGIGVATPTAVLHIKAGSASAGTAPLKFTSGTLLTAPEAGAIEFLSDAYYGTITTGAARKQFAFTDSNITGTASNVTGIVAPANGGTGLDTSATSGVMHAVGGTWSAMTGTANYGARWTDANTLGIGVIYDNGTNVGIGTTSPTAKLWVAQDSTNAAIVVAQAGTGNIAEFRDGASAVFTIADGGTVTTTGNINIGGVINGGADMAPNLLRNSYMNLLSGTVPAGYAGTGVSVEAVSAFTKGFEGCYLSSNAAPCNAATAEVATAASQYWYGSYNKGPRIQRGGLASGWHSSNDGNILKVTGTDIVPGTHSYVSLPFERTVLGSKWHFKAWVKIVKGSQACFGSDAGYNGNYAGSLCVTKAVADAADQGWYRFNGTTTTSQITSLDGLALSLGTIPDGSGDVEVYVALPYVANLNTYGTNQETWVPGVTDTLSRNGIISYPVTASTNNIGIGVNAPTAALHIKAGTTAAGTAPLKFTSGSLLTAAEAGAMEFLSDAYYGTITTGAARKQFAFTDSNITGTASNVTGIVAVENGGTGTVTGSITGTGALAFTAGGTDQSVTLTPSGAGYTLLSGNVGIGTAAPASTLHVVGSSLVTGTANFTGSVSIDTDPDNNASGFEYGNGYNPALSNYYNERFRVNSFLETPHVSMGVGRNYLLQTEAFDVVANWVRTDIAAAVTANGIAAPNGVTSAENITAGSTPTANIAQTVTDSTTGYWSAGIWARAATATTVKLRIDSNMETGTEKTVTLYPEWRFFSVSQNFTVANASKTFRIINGQSVISLWGARLNPGETVNAYRVNTLYQSTTAATGVFFNNSTIYGTLSGNASTSTYATNGLYGSYTLMNNSDKTNMWEQIGYVTLYYNATYSFGQSYHYEVKLKEFYHDNAVRPQSDYGDIVLNVRGNLASAGGNSATFNTNVPDISVELAGNSDLTAGDIATVVTASSTSSKTIRVYVRLKRPNTTYTITPVTYSGISYATNLTGTTSSSYITWTTSGAYAVVAAPLAAQQGEIVYGAVRDAIFKSDVGIGTAAPTAVLHIKAGSASAGTAPLKFTSGTNLTAAEAGAMEYDGTNLYFTPGAARKTVAFTDGNITGTASNVTGMVANANGGTGLDTSAASGVMHAVSGTWSAMTGTANYTARWTDANTLGTGALYDNGTNVGIGTASPSAKLEVAQNSTSTALTVSQSGTGDLVDFKDGGASVFKIADGGTVSIVGYAGVTGTLAATNINSGLAKYTTGGNYGFNNAFGGQSIEQVPALNDFIGNQFMFADARGYAITTSGSVTNVLNSFRQGDSYTTITNATQPIVITVTGAMDSDTDVSKERLFLQAHWAITAHLLVEVQQADDAWVTLADEEIDLGAKEYWFSQAIYNVAPYPAAWSLKGARFTITSLVQSPTYLRQIGFYKQNGFRYPFLAEYNPYFYGQAINASGGSAALPSYTWSGDTDSGMFSPTAGSIAFANDGAEKLRLNANGQLGLGTTSPTAVLHLKAGSASAGTAPLKFTSGTNLTAPEAGAMEYDGTNLYFTPGAARKTIAFTDSSITGTAANVTGIVAVANGGTGLDTSASSGVMHAVGGTWSAMTGTAGYNAYWSDANTIAAEQYVSVARGGTGAGTFTANGMLYGSGTGALNVTAAGTNNYLLYSNSGTPAWTNAPTISGANITSINAGNISSGTLGVGNGGTGATTLTGVIKGNGTSAMTAMTGTANYGARWTDANTLGAGTVYDNGTNVGIGTATPGAYRLNVSGNTYITGDFTVSGKISGVKNALNTVNSNLGTPTVEEMALFQGQYSNKLRFIPAVTQEQSADGVTWTPSTRASANVLADLMLGEGQTTNLSAIPSLSIGTSGYYRLTWDADDTGYVYLNTFYAYTSTNGNVVNIKLEKYHNTSGWTEITNGDVDNWPGHVNIPHTMVPFNASNANYYGQVRVTFSIAAAETTNAMTLYGIEWFGGYPAGKRNVESYDRNKNVTFPAAIRAAAGTASLPGFAFGTDIDSGLFAAAPDSLGIATGGTEKVRIDSSGNLGIGTTAPAHNLSVVGAGGTGVQTIISVKQTDDGAGHEGGQLSMISSGWGEWGLSVGDPTNQANRLFFGQAGYMTFGSYSAGFDFLDTGKNSLMRILDSGKVGIGVAAPSAVLHLKAGTASAGSAPLKFISGTSLTAAEAGAMEYDGTNLYFTPAAARKTISFTDSSISGTASNVTGIVAVANGGTGTDSGSITGTGALAFAAGGTNQNVVLTPSGTGYTLLNGNVGIGNTAPTASLSIKTADALESGVLGGELVDANSWTSDGWTGDYATGFTHTVGNTTVLSRAMTNVIGDSYRVYFTVTGYTAGSFTVGLGGDATNRTYAADGSWTYGFRILSTNGALTFTPSSTFNGVISAISVKRVTAYGATLDVVDSTGTNAFQSRFGLAAGDNLFLGHDAGRYNVTGVGNTALGSGSLAYNTVGVNNVALGHEALYGNTAGNYNVAIGVGSLYDNISGQYNTSIGNNAMGNNTVGEDNVAVGMNALELNISGDANTAVGVRAMDLNSTGDENTVMGNRALRYNSVGSENSAFGYEALYYATGSYGSAFGHYALYDVTSGESNTAIGRNTGRGITTGSYNTIIGAGVTGLAANLSNTVILADGQGNQRFYIDSTGKAGIGTTAPDAMLSVRSTAQNAVVNIYGVTSDTDYGAIQVSSAGSLTNAGNRALVFQPNAGYVGIGTTEPEALLHVSSATTVASMLLEARSATDGDSLIRLKAGNGTSLGLIGLNDDQSNMLVFKAGSLDADTSAGGPHMVIDSTGKVGIGTEAPLSKLSLKVTAPTEADYKTTAGTGALSTYVAYSDGSVIPLVTGINSADDTPVVGIWGYQTGVGTYLRFGTSNGYTTGITNTAMSIDYDGNVGIGTGAPTARLEVAHSGVSPALRITQSGTGDLVDVLDTGVSIFKIGQATVEITRPLDLQVEGDVGIEANLQFLNNATSFIGSAGSLTLSAGDTNSYEHLTLTTSGTGDVIVDIAGSTIGFKVLGTSGKVFSIDSSGNVVIGGTDSGDGTLTAKGNLSTQGGNLDLNSLDTPAGATVAVVGTPGSAAYSYRITAINDNGETLASVAGTTSTGNATLSATTYTRVAWTAVAGATGYKIYGRTGGSELYMTTVNAPTLTYSDIGTVATPAGALPAVNNTGGSNITYAAANGPKRSIILTATGAELPASGGAAQTKVAGTNHTYYVLDYDAAADEGAYWHWTMPDSYDGGAIDVTYYWEVESTSTNNVIWCFQAVGVTPNNSESIDTGLSTAVCETDAGLGTAKYLASATESMAASNFAAGEYVAFKVYRDADDGSDTMAADARLVKVKLEYSVNAESD